MATAEASATAAAGGGRVTTVTTETLAGSRVLMTVDGFTKLKEASYDIEFWTIKSERFCAGGRSWYIQLSRSDNEEGYEDWVSVYLGLVEEDDDDEVKARYEVALLSRAGERIAGAHNFFSFVNNKRPCVEMLVVPNASPIIGERFQVMLLCEVINDVAAVMPPDLHRHLGGLLASQQVGGDVTFQVGDELFTAHKNILAARSPVFMADLFCRPPGKENATRVRIYDIEPRVFRALLHFIYTESLPDVSEGDDKVAMAQGLLVAADRYGMERLKLICADILCVHTVALARTVATTLELAEKHTCPRLKQVCTKIIKDLNARVAP